MDKSFGQHQIVKLFFFLQGFDFYDGTLLEAQELWERRRRNLAFMTLGPCVRIESCWGEMGST